MRRRILTIVVFSIVIGIIALSLNTALGNQTVTYIKKIRVETMNTVFYYYKFDFSKYILNLGLSTTDLSILVFETPTRQWQNTVGWAELGNNLAVILDYVILIINIILYPFKIGSYLTRNYMAILGINQDMNDPNNGLGWLVYFNENILGQIAIPYI